MLHPQFFQHGHLLKRHVIHTKRVIPGKKRHRRLHGARNCGHTANTTDLGRQVSEERRVGQITIAVRFLAPAVKRDHMRAVQCTKSVTYPRFCPKSTRRRYGPGSTRFQASAQMELPQYKHRSKHAQPTRKQVQHAQCRHRNTT